MIPPAEAAVDEPEGPTVPISTPPADPEAPWGRRVDGTPKAKPGAKAGPKTASSGPRKVAAPKSRPPGAASKKADGPDYRAALVGLMALPVGIASMGARLVKDERKRKAIQLDALTVKIHGPAVAEALNNTAKTNAKVAAALDHVVSVGPYGEIIAAVAPIVLQCLANHGAIEPNPEIGIMTPEQVVAVAVGG